MAQRAAGQSAILTDRQIAQLNSQLTGDVISPACQEYESARRIWNHMIDRYPAAVVRCANQSDVAVAITFAREHGVELAVRGGGHSLAGHSVIDDGLVIDLSAMRHVKVEPDIGRVRVQGGCLLADLDRATQAFGLATPAGVMSLNRRRRAHTRWRDGVADPQVRSHVRQPARR